MYRKIVWCYIIVLALLDISLNTKLSAQGKSHGNGVSVHESLMEGISLQEWGKEAGEAGGAGGARGRAAPAEALALTPPALEFGRAALAAAHARSVTLTNTGNETIHLASVAGTTPDFHASFFESKTLVPQANTTFSVVFLGRREGPVSTHLFIHTSRGLLRYPVSAEGVASAWRVWPLVGLRVPLNATLEPMLTLYNPTDTTIQVSEVYSSGAWLGLQLPGGGSAAPRQLWTLPPRARRDLVRLRIHAPHLAAAPAHAPHRAYIRIKANMTGGGLVVGVEAVGAAPGEYLYPLQLRLRTHGSRDLPDTFTLEAGTTDEVDVKLEAEVWGARCAAAPRDPPRPPTDGLPARPVANGARAESGAHVSLLREALEARAPPAPAARLTLDYGAMWAGAEVGAGGEAWCAGWARVGRAAAPYTLRLRRGTLLLEPPELQ